MSFNPGMSGISGASDVAFTSPATGKFLGYNSGVGKWQDSTLTGYAALATGGGSETIVAANATGTYTINLANANVFNLTLTGSTTFSFSGATNGRACAVSVYLTEDGTGGRTVTWPASVRWAGGTDPVLTTTANAVNILVFETLNGGTTWFGSLVGANFS